MTDQTPTPPPENIEPAAHAFFLDFDGTLAPIVDRPEDVAMAASTVDLLRRLEQATSGAVALVTGRSLESLRPHLQGLEFVISGSHGHEWHWPGGKSVVQASNAEVLAAPFETLRGFAERHGLRLERKPGALALHYRDAPNKGAACRDATDEAADLDPALRAIHGNCVSEVALSDAGKDKALLTLLGSDPFRGRTPIMVGDDVTDEDGFRAAAESGGFGLRIGTGPTQAAYQVTSMQDFLDWLDGLLA